MCAVVHCCVCMRWFTVSVRPRLAPSYVSSFLNQRFCASGEKIHQRGSPLKYSYTHFCLFQVLAKELLGKDLFVGAHGAVGCFLTDKIQSSSQIFDRNPQYE